MMGLKRETVITREPIPGLAELDTPVISDGIGAVARFSGVVRAKEGESQIEALDYEVYEAMAYRQFDLIVDQIAEKWPTVALVKVIHRVGRVPVKEPSLWVEVQAPHRLEAFEAMQFLIDTMKQTVPIWKASVCD